MSGNRRFAFLSSAALWVGAGLAIAAFAAFLLLGSVLNPALYPVMVVTREVAAGETLTRDMLGPDAQQVHPRVAAEYVLADELPEYLGAMVLEPLHPGDPLTKARLVRADNPAAVRHIALALDDPAVVAMVIPVTAETAPDTLRAGDRVNVIFGVGNVPLTESEFTQSASVGSAITLPPAEGGAPPVVAAPTAKANLPLAKQVLRAVPVLAVQHEQRPNPAYTGEEGSGSPFIEGEIQSVVVAAPGETEELLAFAINNGTVRLALVSPAAPEEEAPSPGVTWEDVLAFFEEERAEYQGRVNPTPGLETTPIGTPISTTPEIEITLTVTPLPPTLMPDASPTPPSATIPGNLKGTTLLVLCGLSGGVVLLGLLFLVGRVIRRGK